MSPHERSPAGSAGESTRTARGSIRLAAYGSTRGWGEGGTAGHANSLDGRTAATSSCTPVVLQAGLKAAQLPLLANPLSR